MSRTQSSNSIIGKYLTRILWLILFTERNQRVVKMECAYVKKQKQRKNKGRILSGKEWSLANGIER